MPRAKKKKVDTETTELNVAHWDDVIYNIQHRVAFCDPEIYCGFMEKVYDRHMHPGGLGAACCSWEQDKEGERDVIQYWFNSVDSPTVAPSIIAHEITHGVDYTFRQRHMPTGFKSTEARAYLTGALAKVVPRLLTTLGVKVWKEDGDG